MPANTTQTPAATETHDMSPVYPTSDTATLDDDAISCASLGVPVTYADPSPSDDDAARNVELALRVDVLTRAVKMAFDALVKQAGGGAAGIVGAVKVLAAMRADADLAVASTALAELAVEQVSDLLASTPTSESVEVQRSRRLAADLDALDDEGADSAIAAYDRTHGAPIRVPTDFLAAARHNTVRLEPVTTIPAPRSHARKTTADTAQGAQ
jgi:hypothetical protein